MNRTVRNVILIVSDTLRRDHVGAYGNDWIHTPHLDRFAVHALRFDQAFSSSFPTVPLRNDILTGRATFTYKPWSPLDRDEQTLQETLNDAGLVTGLFVDTPHPFALGFNYQRGFQAWELIRGQEHDKWKTYPRDPELPCAPEKLRNPYGTVKQYLRNVHHRNREQDYFPARTMSAAAGWLEENYADPFFLYVDTFDPHEPWDPPQYYVDLYDPDYDGEEVIYPSYDRVDYLSDAELKHCRALYAGEVTLVDRWVGHLLERAESLGLMDNTAIIFISDHGFYLGEHGYMGKSLITEKYQQAIPLLPEVCHIPLLAHMPGQTESAATDALAQPLDLMPTILSLLGVEVPESCAGHSLTPVLQRNADSVREIAIASPTLSSQGMTIPHPTARASIMDGEWMLVYGSQVDQVTDPETTAMVDSIMRQVRTLEEGPIRPQLFNLRQDPTATKDIIDSHGQEAQRLHGRLVGFLERHNVPEKHLRFFRSL